MLKMRAVFTLLVLLLPMCGSLTLGTQTEVHTESQSTVAAAAAAAAEVSTQLDVSAELRELRDMVVELKVLVRLAKEDLDKIDGENDALKLRLVASETKVEALERVNLAQDAEMTAVETRLAASETEVVNLRKEGATQTADLRSVTERLAATETDVVDLKKESKDSKVAFSAGLTNSGYVQSVSTDLNLVFTKIITNVGGAYSSNNGFFTAPVRGVYYFRFTVADTLSSRNMLISIVHNGKQIMWLAKYDNDSTRDYLSSGVTLQLAVGDKVNMRLPADHRLRDDSDNHCTFSGFLLFTN